MPSDPVPGPAEHDGAAAGAPSGGDAQGCPYAIPGPAGADRRAFVRGLVALGVGVPASVALAACGGDRSPMMDGSSAGGMPDWMMAGEGRTGGGMMRDMRVIRDLLRNHEEIRRRVEDVPGGVRSVTTSADERVVARIRTHVWQMKERVEQGATIRPMDPLFREIFEHHQEIRMTIEDVEHGVQVTETSDDPQVAMLIRQHARRAVSEFVAEGMSRAMEPTPLPSGYRR